MCMMNQSIIEKALKFASQADSLSKSRVLPKSNISDSLFPYFFLQSLINVVYAHESWMGWTVNIISH